MKTWNNIDKSDWPRGKWDNEPDKAHWIDDKTGLDCLIVRNGSGALCGYVGIPKDHEFFEKCYVDVDDDIDVHGGLTFADKCHPTKNEGEGICHPKKGSANDIVWWLGFDCAHWNDISPAFFRIHGDSVYRDFGYVRDQVSGLAKQLK